MPGRLRHATRPPSAEEMEQQERTDRGSWNKESLETREPMHRDHDAQLLKALQSAAEKKDSQQLAALLGAKPSLMSNTIDDPLIYLDAQNIILQNDLESPGRKPLLLALLNCVPSAYELPWIIVCRLTAHRTFRLHPSTLSVLQQFLRSTTAAWCHYERKQVVQMSWSPESAPRKHKTPNRTNQPERTGTPRDYIIRIVQEGLRSVLSEAESMEETESLSNLGDETNGRGLREWMMTVIMMVNSREDAALMDTCLDTIVQIDQKTLGEGSVRVLRIVSWLRLVADLLRFLRPTDWTYMESVLQETTNTPRDAEWFQAVGPTIRCNMFLATQNVSPLRGRKAESLRSDRLLTWQSFLVRLLECTADGKYSVKMASNEQILLRSLNVLNPLSLRLWTRSLLGGIDRWYPSGSTGCDRSITKAIHCALLLWTSQASRSLCAEIMNRVITQVLGPRNRSDIEIKSLCWKGLVQLTMEKRSLDGAVLKPFGDDSFICGVTAELKHVTYKGKGIFFDHTGHRHHVLSSAGTRIYNVILLISGHTSTDDERLGANNRAKALADLAMHMVENAQHQEDSGDGFLIYLILVMAYCEARDIRHSLVSRFSENFVSFSFYGRPLIDRAALLCSVLSTLLASDVGDIAAPGSALEGMAVALTDNLPYEIFVQLVSCLSSIKAIREKMLKLAEKELRDIQPSSFLQDAENGEVRRAQEDFYRLQRGLHAAVTILACSVWGSCEIRAWILVSDVLIVGRPHLPPRSRTLLYEQLMTIANMDQLDLNACECMLSIVLLRLLALIESNGEKERFDAGSAGSDHSHLTRCSEDIPELLRLAVALCYAMVKIDGKLEALTAIWHFRIVHMVCSQSSGNVNNSIEQLQFNEDDSAILVHGSFFLISLLVEGMSDAAVYLENDRARLNELTEHVRARARFLFSTTGYFPEWLTSDREHGSIVRSGCKNSDHEPKKLSPNLASGALSGVVAEILFGERCSKYFEKSDSSQLGPYLQSDLISGLSQIIVSGTQLPSCRPAWSGVSAASLVETYLSFMKLAIPIVSDRISDTAALKLTDSVLNAVISLCNTLADVLLSQHISAARYGELIRTTWSVYLSICSEYEAVRMREYYVKVAGGLSEEEIDLFVRTLRHAVIKVFVILIPLVWQSKSTQISIEQSPELDEFDATAGTLEFLSTTINACASDLVEGLKGRSGKIDFDLFDTYHECLGASIAEAVKQLSHCADEASIRQFARISWEASRKLEMIVYSYTLQQAGIFKTTLMFSMYNLPYGTRTAMRQVLLMSDVDKMKWRWDTAGVRFSIDSLRQCLDIAARRDINKAWEDFVGKHHLIDDPNAPEAGVGAKSHSFLQLASENHWIWAFCTTLESLEYLWEESLTILQNGPTMNFKKSKCSLLYSTIRQKQLAEAWESVCSVLRSKGDGGIMAEYLPARVRLRLLAVLDRIVTVQQKALKTLSQCIAKQSSVSRARCLDVVEAIGCVMILLSAPPSTDLIISASEWCADETEHKQKAKAVNMKFEQLTMSLKQFVRILSSRIDLAADLLKKLDGLLGSEECESDGESSNYSESGGIRSRLLDLVRAKCKQIDKSHRKLSDSERALKRTRELEIVRRARKQRKQKLIRSRNKAIDEFYEDDRRKSNFFIEESGVDDAFDDDPFADLEDFLVEG